MLFGHRKMNDDVQVEIMSLWNNDVVEKVYENKFWGVLIDHELEGPH